METGSQHVRDERVREAVPPCRRRAVFCGEPAQPAGEGLLPVDRILQRPAGTNTLANMRAAAGDRDPFKVRYWGVGNESWGCGGEFTPEEYATEYRRFTAGLRASGWTSRSSARGRTPPTSGGRDVSSRNSSRKARGSWAACGAGAFITTRGNEPRCDNRLVQRQGRRGQILERRVVRVAQREPTGWKD